MGDIAVDMSQGLFRDVCARLLFCYIASASSPDGVKVGQKSYGSTIFGVYLGK